jgi:glucose-6-phosphate isomerase
MADKSESKGEMTTPVQLISSRDAWKAFETHQQKIGELHLRKLFTEDPKRGDRFAIEAAGISLDYSKNRITQAWPAAPNSRSNDKSQ